MCRRHNTPMQYEHEQLMSDLNAFMAAIKIHLHSEEIGLKEENRIEVHGRYPKPEIKDIDEMQQRINQVLSKDAKPFIRH